MAVAGFLLLLFMVNLRPGVSAAHFNYTSSPRKPKLDSRYFPSPILQPVKCGRVNKSFVCDPEKILLPIQAKQLDDLISSKTNTFKCVCKEKCVSYRDKYVIMVAIAPRIKVKKGATMEEKKLAVDTFAKDLLERGWAGGNCDNDIIIVLSTEYRRIATFVGRETRRIVTALCIRRGNESVAPFLEQDKYFAAVQELVIKYSTFLNRTTCGPVSPKDDRSLHPVILYVLIAVIGAIGLSLALWTLRICIMGVRNWKERRRQKHGAENTSAWNDEGTVVYSDATRTDGDHDSDSDSHQDNDNSPDSHGSRRKESPSDNSPQPGTSSGQRGDPLHNFHSCRDNRPKLFLDLSKVKRLDEERNRHYKAEEANLDTEY